MHKGKLEAHHRVPDFLEVWICRSCRRIYAKKPKDRVCPHCAGVTVNKRVTDWRHKRKRKPKKEGKHWQR